MNDAPPPDAYELPRGAVARSFGRASKRYDAAARLQAVVREELLSRLETMHLAPARILDLGAGTGLATQRLKRLHRRAQVVAVDIAPAMLGEVGRRSRFWRPLQRVAADALQLPFAAASFDIVFSSLMFQWCDDPAAAFAQVRHVLKPGGLLLFSSFGPETLRELRDAWAAVDDATHVNRFIDMHDLGSALQRSGFSEPVLDVDRHVLRYPDARALMRELKDIGAHNVTAGRSRALTGRQRLQRMIDAYELLRGPQGLPATYEVVYAAAWGAGEALDAGSGLPGETRISLESLAGSLKGPRR